MTPADFRGWRKGLGLSRKEAAEALGLSVHTLANYETGKRRVKGGPPERVEIPHVVTLACAFLALQKTGLAR